MDKWFLPSSPKSTPTLHPTKVPLGQPHLRSVVRQYQGSGQRETRRKEGRAQEERLSFLLKKHVKEENETKRGKSRGRSLKVLQRGWESFLRSRAGGEVEARRGLEKFGRGDERRGGIWWSPAGGLRETQVREPLCD